MLHRIKVTSQFDHHFDMCWALYQESFPEEERRDREYHIATMEEPGFSFDAILDDLEFVGIIGWWQFGSMRYIEHFAILPSLRDRGYGRRALEKFIGGSSDIIVLEVEHPICEMSQRRIGFYQRLGLFLNNYNYSHPPYQAHHADYVSLELMSYPSLLTPDLFEEFKCECYSRVHFRGRM